MAEKVELTGTQLSTLMKTMDQVDDGKANGSYRGPNKMHGENSWFNLSQREYRELTAALGSGAKPRKLTEAEIAFAQKTGKEAKNLTGAESTAENTPQTKPGVGMEQIFGSLLTEFSKQEAQIAAAIKDLNAPPKKNADGTVEDSGSRLFKAQQAAEKSSRMMAMITNISKSIHEMLQGIIRNFR